MSVIVTESAAREINAIVQQQGLDPEKIRLRVGVKGGGCSGFSYILDLTEVQKDTDELWEFTYRTSEDGKTVTRVEGAAAGGPSQPQASSSSSQHALIDLTAGTANSSSPASSS